MVAEGLHAEAGAPARASGTCACGSRRRPVTDAHQRYGRAGPEPAKGAEQRAEGYCAARGPYVRHHRPAREPARTRSRSTRERFLRRYQRAGARGGGARDRRPQHRRDRAAARTSTIPKRDMTEPMFSHGAGGARESVHPRQQGVRARRPDPAAAGRRRGGSGSGARRRRRGRGRRFVFRLIARRVHQTSSSRTWRCRDLIKTQLAAITAAQALARRLPDRRHAVQPRDRALDARRARPPHRHQAAVRGARCASSRPSWKHSAATTPTATTRASSALLEDLETAPAQDRRVPFIDPFDLRFRNRVRQPVPTAKAVMFCLMDVSGSMDEARKDLAKRFFILLLPVPDAPLRADRDRLHPPPHQAQEVDEEDFFHSPRDRRHGRVERADADGRDHHASATRRPSGTSTSRRRPTATTGTTIRGRCRELLAERASCRRCRYYAYVAGRRPASRRTCGRNTRRLRASRPHFALRTDHATAPQIYPVLPRPVQAKKERRPPA